MKNYSNRAIRFSFSIKEFLFLLLMICTVKVDAQQVVVLPSNGTNSQHGSPQGSVRQHRAFYLISPAEMQSSGISGGTVLNSIGFTLGTPQSFNTKGAFKLYLQNTADRNSRRDETWTNTTVTGTSLSLSTLGQGLYEWRVQARCGASNSLFSDTALFSTNSEDTCKAPTSLFTSNITTSGARFNWTAPASNLASYFILYKTISSQIWSDTVIVNAPAGFYDITGLLPDSTYEWRIKSNCGDTSSSGAGTVFTTLYIASPQCAVITSATVPYIGNDSVHLKWNAVAGAINYQIEYRRHGTANWNGTFSITDSVVIGGLRSATDYQWRIKTVCGVASFSNYFNGLDFKTTGSPNTCYAPENLQANTVTNSTASLNWNAVDYANEYIVSYRLKESISWANALLGMSNVHNDSLVIPVTTGRYNIPFVNGTTANFNYTGEGLYVAWEFSRDTGALSLPNTTMGTDLYDTSGLIAPVYTGFVAKDTGLTLPLLLTSTSVRPETLFGSLQLNDSVAVSAVFALGKIAPAYARDTIKAIINNFKTSAKNYLVKLTVRNSAGMQRYTADSMVNIAANGSAEVSFKGWIPSILETDSIIVSVPNEHGENVFNNNRKYYLQQVTSNQVSVADNTTAFSSTGFGNLDGLILAKYYMKGCAKVNGAKIYLDVSAVGKQVYAVILNNSGIVISQSDNYTVTEETTNNYYPFHFSSPAFLQNEGYYIGLAQIQNSNSYLPVGVQWEADSIRYGSYYRAKLDATDLMEVRSPGRLMIESMLAPGASSVSIEGKLSLCSGATNTLTSVKEDARFANKVLGKSGELSTLQFGSIKTLGAPDVYPQHGFNANAWTAANVGNERRYLTLQFPNPAPINFIDIYETLNPGSIDTVYVKDPVSGLYVNVYDTTASFTDTVAHKKRIKLTSLTGFAVDEVRIALSFDPERNYNAIDAVAIGQITQPGGFSTYLWTPGPETSDTKQVSAPGVYKVEVLSAGGCSASANVTVYEPSQIPPVIIVVGSLSFCAGDSVKLVSSQSSGNTWSPGGATTKEIVVSTAGSYSVSYNDGTGCGITTSSPVVVIVNTSTPVTITGNLNICPGNSTVLDAGSGFSSYLWSTGATSQTISVNTAASFSVIAFNNNGCRSTASVTTTYASLAPPVIAGVLDLCPGSSTVLDAGTGYSSYLWSTGATSQTITVSTPGTFDVAVTNAGGCTASASVVTTLFTPPSPQITGNPGFCAGGSTALTATLGFASYAWSTGATSQSISVSTPGAYTVTVTDANGCTGSKSITVSVFVAPSPTISGTLSFCGGTSTTLNAGPGYSTYSWSPGGQTTQTITVSTVGTFSVTVTSTNGCSGSASATTTNTGSLPASPGAISGPGVASCNTSGNTYTISPVPNTSHYVWTVPSGATITSGQGSTSINVNYNSTFQGGYIIVAASNACGQSPSITVRKLFVQALANMPGAITGQSSGLCGPATKVYSIAAVSMATSYTWSAPAGATITGGQGSTSVTVSFNAGFSYGNICVVANNACGSTAPSCKLLSGVSPTPGAISGPTAVCKNESNLMYGIDPVAGATSYTWTVPQSAQISFGQGSTNIVVKMGPNSGTVTVKANSACGSSGVRSLAVIVTTCFNEAPIFTMKEIRPVPEVVSSYGGSGNAGGNYFEWTMGEPRVESIQKPDYLYSQGFHQPLVYIIPVTQTDTAILVKSDKMRIIVFPNPVSSVLSVKIEMPETKPLVLELVDVNSRLLQRKNITAGFNKNQVEFQMTGYIGGSYYLMVRDTNGVIINTVKLVKLD